MKQYLLLFKTSDFVKNGNVWTTEAINLYSNSQYKNFSTYRSNNGLNLIGDGTFVGTEVTSPSDVHDATPLSANVVYVTDYGEVVYESANPAVKRFIDTTSKIDIIGYTYRFLNVQNGVDPNFSLSIFQSDTAESTSGLDVADDPLWIKSDVSSNAPGIFLTDALQNIRLRINVDAPEETLSSLGILFYLEISIHDPVSPVMSNAARAVAARFPTWTKIYEDSLPAATPSLATPNSLGGKFINSLIRDEFDRLQRFVNLENINAYIQTADVDQICWIYRSSNVAPNLIRVVGDGINLSPLSSFDSLLSSRKSDRVYYYDPIQKHLYTTREYSNLTVDFNYLTQEPVHIFNDFDEFGMRVSLPRLFLEDNTRYKQRILDYSVNLPANSMEGFKRTVRRELDLWRSYGATPDSNFVGATPEVYDIEYIESSSPYVDYSGKPTSFLENFVEKINKRYPSNFGYVKWSEGTWDYAGALGEGVSRLPMLYDELSSPLGEYYTPGVGDLQDVQLVVDPSSEMLSPIYDAATVNFSAHAEISGIAKTDQYETYYPPIAVDYSWIVEYIVSGDNGTPAEADFTYIISVPEYGSGATPASFYSNLNSSIIDELSVNASSPDFNTIDIFDDSGYTFPNIPFYNVVDGIQYVDDSVTPNIYSIDIEKVSTVYMYPCVEWDHVNTQFITTSSSGTFSHSFSTPGSSWYLAEPSNQYSVSVAGSLPDQLDVLIYSEVDSATPVIERTERFNSRFYLNKDNDFSESGTPTVLTRDDFIKSVYLSDDAEPSKIYIDVTQGNRNYQIYNYGSDSLVTYGGYAETLSTDYATPGETMLVPSSPNIVYYEEGEIPWVYDYELAQVGSNIQSVNSNEGFGFAFAISSDGSRIAATERYNDTSGLYAGALRVLEWSGSSWAQLGSDIYGSAGEELGASVAISADGSRVAVGSTAASSSTGLVRIYDWDGSSWGQVGSDILGETSGDISAYAIALSSDGSIVAIGAIENNNANGANSGHVRIYQWSGSSWTQLGTDIDGESAGDQFGWSVALSSNGTRLAAGAYFNDGNGTSSGHVRIYDWDGSSWTQAGADIDGEAAGDNSGEGLALSSDGSRVAIGAWRNDDGGTDSGHVRVFDWDGSSWTQVGSDIDGEAAYTRLASSVGLSGDGTRLVVGSSNSTNTSDGIIPSMGKVKIYDWSGSSWVLIDEIWGDNSYDSFGIRVGISSDGDTVVGSSINAEFIKVYQYQQFKNYNLSYSYTTSTVPFETATVNWNHDFSLNISSVDSNYYPFQKLVYSRFSEQTTPGLIEGYIDRYGNTYSSDESPVNTYYNSDNFYGKISLSKESFALNNAWEYNIEDVKLVSDTDNFNVYSDSPLEVNKLNEAFSNNSDSVIDIFVDEQIENATPIFVGVKSGWIHLDESEYYVYSNKVTEEHYGSYFELDLQEAPGNAAPVIVNVGSTPYRYSAIPNSATPTQLGFVNQEDISNHGGDSLYLSYANVKNVSVEDLDTGTVLFTGIESSSNVISPFDSSTPLVPGKEYRVTYTLNESFFVEKNIYDESSDTYMSKILFSSTPNSNENYELIYESSDYRPDSVLPIDLRFDQMVNPLNEGFVYVSFDEYDFNYIDAVLSPGYISDQVNDYMNLHITSYDINGNPKGGQSFRVVAQHASATPEYVTTNDYGSGNTVIRYNGQTPAIVDSDTLSITGVGAATPGGSARSMSDGYSLDVDYKIVRSVDFNLIVKAISAKLVVDADGNSDVVITGQVYYKGRPFERSVPIKYTIGETLYQIFEGIPDASGNLISKEDGSFTISGLIKANDRTKPGIRFGAIEIDQELIDTQSLLIGDDTIAADDITISGDVVYWNERYDTIHYHNERLPLGGHFTKLKEPGSNILDTANFRYTHGTSSVVTYSGATPNWEPPIWFPIDRYSQYQMGILSATPNKIENYQNLHYEGGDS